MKEKRKEGKRINKGDKQENKEREEGKGGIRKQKIKKRSKRMNGRENEGK